MRVRVTLSLKHESPNPGPKPEKSPYTRTLNLSTLLFKICFTLICSTHRKPANYPRPETQFLSLFSGQLNSYPHILWLVVCFPVRIQAVRGGGIRGQEFSGFGVCLGLLCGCVFVCYSYRLSPTQRPKTYSRKSHEHQIQHGFCAALSDEVRSRASQGCRK